MQRTVILPTNRLLAHHINNHFGNNMSKPILRLISSLLIVFTVTIGCSKKNDPATGFIDTPAKGEWYSPNLVVEGWVFDPELVDSVELILNGEVVAVETTGLARLDVASAFPEVSMAASSGFRISADLSDKLIGSDVIRVESVDKKQGRTILGQFELTENKNYNWKDLLKNHADINEDPFYLAVATSGLRGAVIEEMISTYKEFDTGTVRLGLRIPILYMRATKGAEKDWVFDPNFDTDTKGSNGRKINDDSLNNIIQLSKQFKIPLMVTLNGGVWADASGTSPEWDLIDHLEEDPNNCQWTSNKEVLADNYLSELPGSTSSPELARSLSLSIYADQVRMYKERNLKSAASIIKGFADENPELFIGINVDPDVYINPFFEGDEWFDYNPLTIRQFREWVSGTGPYAKGGKLEKWKYGPSLTLQDVNQTSGQEYSKWGDVEAPIPGLEFWRNDWFVIWKQFRRHLVHMHHEDITRWVSETGIPTSKIFTSQGFADVSKFIMPFPIYIKSPGKNYDTAGVSIEGAKPDHGHLGAIMYGATARNEVRMEEENDFFSQVQMFDLDWAVPEFNLASISEPAATPDYEVSYDAFRQLLNSNVRLISPMAWNGSNGIYAGEPGFVSYTSWRNTPQEQAFIDFGIARQGLSRYSKFWPFGFNSHRSDDGWKGINSTIDTIPAKLIVASKLDNSSIRSGQFFLKSPGQYELVIKIEDFNGTLNLDIEISSGKVNGSSTNIQAELVPIEENVYKLTIPESKIPENPVNMTLDFVGQKKVTLDYIALISTETN